MIKVARNLHSKSDKGELEIVSWACEFDGKNLRTLLTKSSVDSELWEERLSAGSCGVSGVWVCGELGRPLAACPWPCLALFSMGHLPIRGRGG